MNPASLFVILFCLHVQEEFLDHIGFEENIDYILRVRIAEGAFGECYLAAELPENKEREFCVKKVTLLAFFLQF